MGMDGARLEVSIADAPLGARGRDAVELRLAANPGLPAGPLGSVASGGELSRIALAVRLAARDGGATEMLVFDEVDAGIGGRTARVLTDKLRELAATAQVLCITHLPQIAAAADRHFLVEKTQGATSEAHVAELSSDEALEELVRMLGADAGDTDARALAVSLRGHAHSLVTRSRDASAGARVPMADPCAAFAAASSPSSCSRPSPPPPRRRRRARRSSRPAATPRWATSGSLSFVVARQQITKLQVRMPLVCQNKRTHAQQRADARPSPPPRASRPREHVLAHLPARRRRDERLVRRRRQRAASPQIYLSLQLKGGIGHVSVHARSDAAREACEGALGFDVRVR